MQNLLITDTETTGIDPNNGKLIEIAAILFHIPTLSVVQQVSTLLQIDDDENDAFKVNRISPETLHSVNMENQKAALQLLCYLFNNCDAVLAHNAKFDREWLELASPLAEISKQKTWICTRADLEWPVRPGTPLNLIHISADLEVPIVCAHRALADCQLLASCLSKLYDLPERLFEATQPKDHYIASISFEDRQLAKNAGFQWNADGKRWEKRMTQKPGNAS